MSDQHPNPPPLRYAVLWHHDIDEPHFDLLLETAPGSQLATWRSNVWPIVETIELLRLKDHRRIFLNFEGELSGSRGNVQRVSEGTCEVSTTNSASITIKLTEGMRVFTLHLDQIDRENWRAIPVLNA